MSCTYYLRDRKITTQVIKELDLLEKDFNSKLNNLYEEFNNKIASILPINNKDVSLPLVKKITLLEIFKKKLILLLIQKSKLNMN